MSSLPATLFTAAVLVVAGTHVAHACRPNFEPGIVGHPAFEPADAVQIYNETVEVTCSELECTVDATYSISVSRPAHVTVTGTRLHDLTLQVDGGESSPDASVAAGAKQIHLLARVGLWPYVDDCFSDGIVARHSKLASQPPSTDRVVLIETLALPRIQYPRGWRLDIDKRSRREMELAGDRTAATTKAAPMATVLWFHTPEPRFIPGGPFLLAGVASGDHAFRLRGGYEVAALRPWLVFGLAADTDVASTAMLGVTADATSRAPILPITTSIGGGAVVALAPDVRPGGRVQLSLALGGLRIAFSTDVLAPVAAGQTTAVSVALLAGLSI